MSMRTAFFFLPALLLTVSGCAQQTGEQADELETQSPDQKEIEESAEQVSILRPDVEAETVAANADAAEGLAATVGFPDGGRELDAGAIAQLDKVKASAPFTGNGAIILGAHSDSAGSDAVNERAAEARGLVVAEWLIAAGADPRRIDVIVFGEQNPAEPNALPDGSPNEAGRALNRRVEIEILASASEEPEAPESKPGDES